MMAWSPNWRTGAVDAASLDEEVNMRERKADASDLLLDHVIVLENKGKKEEVRYCTREIVVACVCV